MNQSRTQSDEQVEAEVTDADEIDVQDFPPDRPMGVGDLLREDVTAAGEYAPDDLRTRDLRLRPDVARADDARITPVAPGGLSDPDDPYDADATSEMVGERAAGDWDVVDPGALQAESAAADHRGVDGWPAEEAALHLVEEGEDGDFEPLPEPRAPRVGAPGDRRGEGT